MTDEEQSHVNSSTNIEWFEEAPFTVKFERNEKTHHFLSENSAHKVASQLNGSNKVYFQGNLVGEYDISA